MILKRHLFKIMAAIAVIGLTIGLYLTLDSSQAHYNDKMIKFRYDKTKFELMTAADASDNSIHLMSADCNIDIKRYSSLSIDKETLLHNYMNSNAVYAQISDENFYVKDGKTYLDYTCTDNDVSFQFRTMCYGYKDSVYLCIARLGKNTDCTNKDIIDIYKTLEVTR